MNNKQEARFARNTGSVNHLEEKREIWKNNLALNTGFEKYWQMHQESFNIVKEQGSKTAGVFNAKSKKKVALAIKALSYAGSLRAFASSMGDNRLLATISFSRSEIFGTRDNKLAPLCMTIIDALRKHSAEMIAYDITPEMTDAFEKTIDEFRIVASSTKNATSERKSLGSRLNDVLDEMDVFAKDQLDPLMLRYETSHPLFYMEYKNNRQIIDPKTSSTQFAGIITDSSTGEPIKKVLVSVQDSTYITNAKKDGKYKLRVPKNGTYILVFEFVGYETVIITEAELKLGKTTEVNVVMKKSV